MSTELHGLMIPPPKLPAKLEIAAEWMQERDKLVSQAAGIQAVTTQAEFTGAEILLKLITAVSNDAEKIRKKLSDPFTRAAKDIKAMADGAREPLEAQKERLKGIMAGYLREVQRRQQEELALKASEEYMRRRAEEERIEAERQAALANVAVDDAGDVDPFAAAAIEESFAARQQEVAAAPAVIEADTADTRKTMTTARTVWRFEIEDATAVPREFCTPDERKIREHVQRNKDAAGIPGVRVWEELAVQAR